MGLLIGIVVVLLAVVAAVGVTKGLKKLGDLDREEADRFYDKDYEVLIPKSDQDKSMPPRPWPISATEVEVHMKQ